MRRFARRGLLVAALSLAVAATAHAESAWVLWEQHDLRIKGRAPQVWWEISDAYENHNECLKDRRVTILDFKAWPKKEGVEYEVQGAYTMITWFLEKDGTRSGSSRSTKLWCLPTGTDPRPRSKE